MATTGHKAQEHFTERFIDLKLVTAKTTVSRSRIYYLVSRGEFPKPVRLGPQSIRWKESVIDAWMDSRPVNDTALRG